MFYEAIREVWISDAMITSSVQRLCPGPKLNSLGDT